MATQVLGEVVNGTVINGLSATAQTGGSTSFSESFGIVNFSSGSFTGAGNAVDIQVGFTPRYVKIVNWTDNITWEWLDGAPSTNALKSIAAGTNTVDATSGITVDLRNVYLTAALAANSSKFSWLAFG